MSTFSATHALTLAAIFVASLLLWALTRQWGITRRFLSGYPLTGALADAVLLIVISHTLHGLLLLLSVLPRLADWRETIELTAKLILHVGYAVAIGRLVEGVISKNRRRPADYRLPRLAHLGFYGVFALFGLISFLVATGQTPTELFILTGAGAAVLAFIMQQTLGDLFSGLSLTLERPLRIGDWIRLADGTEGEVQDINWRATHLRKWDNSTFVIPNGKLAQESFTNLHGKHHPYAPWYTVRVSGDHAPPHVIDLIECAVRSCNLVLMVPEPVVRLMEASVTPYTYMIWVNFADYPTMFAGREELYREIDAKLRASGIEIAMDIHEVRYREVAGPPMIARGSK